MKTGFIFHNSVTRSQNEPRRIQKGIFRVNCKFSSLVVLISFVLILPCHAGIDCLDRTNFAQFCISQKALSLFLEALGFEGATDLDNVYPKINNALKGSKNTVLVTSVKLPNF
jgi:hypothetical protein